ncbi:MAG: DUF4390 domain-containing protein [Gemmatimonadales bacterium]
MRRALLFVAAAVLLGPRTLRAQDVEVALAVDLTPDTATNGARQALIQINHLLDDPRIDAMLGSGFPVRLHYRLELWRSRSGWLDAFERSVEWDVLVRHEPLLDQYTVTTVDSRRTRTDRYAGREGLAAGVHRLTRIAIQPTRAAQYYYVVTLDVTTLSDTDIKELETFLQGDVGPAATGTEDVGSALGRGVRRLLLHVVGLPSLRLETRSTSFRLR